MAAVEIITANKLTIEDVEDLSEEVIDILAINTSVFNDFILKTYDYVDWVVEISGNRYRFLHGFPGDNALGVLVDKDDSSVVLALCGEGGGRLKVEGHEDAQTFLDWYERETAGSQEYKAIFDASNLVKRPKPQAKKHTDSDEEVEEDSEVEDEEEEEDEGENA
eukprot:gene7888-8700_t